MFPRIFPRAFPELFRNPIRTSGGTPVHLEEIHVFFRFALEFLFWGTPVHLEEIHV